MSDTLLNQNENQIRQFLSKELMHEWAQQISLADGFELDSLDQVDLRVFLEETFAVKISPEQKPFKSIQMILEFIDSVG